MKPGNYYIRRFNEGGCLDAQAARQTLSYDLRRGEYDSIQRYTVPYLVSMSMPSSFNMPVGRTPPALMITASLCASIIFPS